MPRRAHSRATIHNRHSGHWDELEPLSTPVLTPEQIRQKRIELAAEMLALVLDDDELGTRPRRTLQGIFTSLGSVRSQL
jgi:hypothetical protein